MNNDETKLLRKTDFFDTSSRFIVIAVITLFVICGGAVRAADSDTHSLRDTHFYSAPPSAEHVGQQLFPTTSEAPIRRTRSISFKEPTQRLVSQKSVSMPVLFDFGKTSIVESSRPFLDSVGEMMLKAQYAQRKLIVEGHTDAIGSESYNQSLSELRALAVKEYLVSRYNINPYRLLTKGKGESMLVQAAKPEDSINRRVEFLPHQ